MNREITPIHEFSQTSIVALLLLAVTPLAAASTPGPVVSDLHLIAPDARPPFVLSWRYTPGVSGALGSSWRCWPFDAAVQPATEGKGRILQTFDQSGGKQLFLSTGTNLWAPLDAAEAPRVSLQQTKSGFVLTDLLHGRQQFDTAGRLVQLSNPQGHRLDVLRNDKGQPRAVVVHHPHEAVFEITCDPATGRLRSIKAPDGRTWSYEYDTAGSLAKAADPTGFALSYRIESGRLAERADSVGHWARYRYDSQDRVVEIDRNGRKETRVYSKLGLFGSDWMVTRTDALGRKSEYRFLASKRQEVLRERDDNVVVRQYDEHWRLEQISSLRDGVTTIERDADGRAVRITDPRERVTQVGYGGLLGLPATVVDGRGGVRKLAYNARGQLTSERLPDGREQSITYNDSGLPLEVTDSERGTLRLEYGPAGKLEAVESEAGRLETTSLRQRASPGAFLDPPAFRRLPFSEPRMMLFLHLSHATLVTGGQGSRAGDFALRTSNGSVLTGKGDLFDNLVSLREKDRLLATFRYDDGDRLLEIQYADKRTERFEYDPADRVVAYTDAAGKVFRYRYDPPGHLIREIFPDGEENVFDYDAAGHLTSGFNSFWHDLFAYDNQDRLVEAGRLTPVSKAPELLARYAYNGQSRLESQFFADGLRCAHEYNTNGTLETLRCQGAKLVIQKRTDGRCEYLFLPGGLKVELGYAKEGGLSRLSVQNSSNSPILTQFGQYQGGRLAKVISKTSSATREYELAQMSADRSADIPVRPGSSDAPKADKNVRAPVSPASSESKGAKPPRDAFGRLRLAERDGTKVEYTYARGGLMSVETAEKRIRVLRSSDGAPRLLVTERSNDALGSHAILFLVPSLIPDEAFVTDSNGANLRPICFRDTRNPELNLETGGAK